MATTAAGSAARNRGRPQPDLAPVAPRYHIEEVQCFDAITESEGVWMAGHDADPGGDSDGSAEIRVLSQEEWRIARAARLAALRDSPGSFLPTEPHESSWSDAQWRRSCETGLWAVARSDRITVGLARLTHERDGPHVGSVWTHPRHRRAGIASRLVQMLVDAAEGRDIFVWVIQPNPAAILLYESLGFKRMDETQEIDGVGTEERLRLERRSGP
jgi:GNAT superfamily N-acetyltransferase